MFASIGRLALIGTLGGAAAGTVAGLDPGGAGIHALSLVGAAFGLGTTALLLETIHGKRLWLAVPLVYIPSLCDALTGIAIGDEQFVQCGFIVGLMVMTLIASLFLPHKSQYALPHCCFQCGYDMTSNESGHCPECGAVWTGARPLTAAEIAPWRTRGQAFLCWWTGCVISGVLGALLTAFVVAVFHL